MSAACVIPSQRVLEPGAALAGAALVLLHVGINTTRLAPQPRVRATRPRAARGNVDLSTLGAACLCAPAAPRADVLHVVLLDPGGSGVAVRPGAGVLCARRARALEVLERV